jgi:DnaD/phage-associated family protein
MPRRMITSAIWTDAEYAALTMRQRLLWIGILTNADDQGRLVGHPGMVRSLVFPLDDISLSDIDSDLTCFADLQWVSLYEAGGKRYIQILKWWEHQQMRWAAPSIYPAPSGWTDRVHYRKGEDVVQDNWTHIDRTPSAKYPPSDGQAAATNPPKSKKEQESVEKESGSKSAPSSSFAMQAERAFENSVSMIPSLVQQQEIDAMLEELEGRGLQDWWQKAIDIACDQNHRSWAYVRGILRNCMSEGKPPGSRPPGGNGHGPPKTNVDQTLEIVNRMIAEEREHE